MLCTENQLRTLTLGTCRLFSRYYFSTPLRDVFSLFRSPRAIKAVSTSFKWFGDAGDVRNIPHRGMSSWSERAFAAWYRHYWNLEIIHFSLQAVRSWPTIPKWVTRGTCTKLACSGRFSQPSLYVKSVVLPFLFQLKTRGSVRLISPVAVTHAPEK